MQANTAAVPLTEYMVDTECGRHFSWAAIDMNDLFRQLNEGGYVARKVLSMQEYEMELKESA